MDPAKFVVNALAPAIISKVIVDQANRSMEVIVPDDQLSLAIGKRGQNVRLASKLTNWRIDVKGESRYERQKQVGYQSLLRISGLSSEIADKLYESGIGSLEEFLETSLVELEDTTRLSASILDMMRFEAQRLLQKDEEQGVAGEPEEQDEEQVAVGEPEKQDGEQVAVGEPEEQDVEQVAIGGPEGQDETQQELEPNPDQIQEG